MKKVKKMDRTTVKKLSTELEDELQDLAEKYGVHIETKGGRFDDNWYQPKLVISVLNDDGEAETPEATAFKQLGHLYGFDGENDLGLEFESNGEIFRITGLKTKAKKFPILAERTRDNKKFKFPAQAILSQFEA